MHDQRSVAVSGSALSRLASTTTLICPMRPEPIYFRVAGDGQIAAEECGDPSGAPVFFFHGWPSSRLQGQGFGAAAQELGLRIISLDRPGIGCSAYCADRRLLDWPPAVAEIARQLGLEK